MASSIILFIILSSFVAVEAQHSTSHFIKPGSSLSPGSNAWYSPSGRFAFGFYPVGNGFNVGIWLVSTDENTTVWTANRDHPPVSSDTSLHFINGQILLRSEENSSDKITIAAGDSAAAFASMLDSGNFVLYRKDFFVIWESFKFPTDTILGGQNLSSGTELISSVSQTNQSTGRFRLSMQVDGNLVMYPLGSAGWPVDAYWASDTYGVLKNHLYLNNVGLLQLINDTSLSAIHEWSSSSPYSDSIIYRAILGDNGNFRVISHNFGPNGYSNKFVKWQVYDNICEVKGLCGFNSFCTIYDQNPNCTCLPGTDFIDSHQNFSGCGRNFIKKRCISGKENATLYSMNKVPNLKLKDPAYFSDLMKEEYCIKSCLEDCDCDAVRFNPDNNICQKYKFPVRYVSRDSGVSYTIYFKVGITSIKSAVNDDIHKPQVVKVTSKKTWMLILVLSLGLVTYSCSALVFSGFFIFKWRVIKYRTLLESGALGLAEEFTLRSYTYKELVQATNGFKEELGKGSFGTVYKGSLYKSKKLVAVKRLEKVVDEGEREFRAEMLVIGRTHHKNLVRLLGYCAEGLKRLLVYQYMSNGSLADLLFRSVKRPDWNERARIALEIARGILYLHEECEAPVIHCDIKPQNILMDDFWTAKISDFGLAKLLMPDQTRTFTGIRGTRGYLAPEWQQNTPISVKVDVFSFGIMLLEIACCRKNLEVQDHTKPEEIVLSTWAYKCFVAGELGKLVGGEQVDYRTFERMIKVGLWCIQDEPALRPSMKSVVLILEGLTDIAIPPCPTSSAI